MSEYAEQFPNPELPVALACLPVALAHNPPVPGSGEGKCALCHIDVWFDPAMFKQITVDFDEEPTLLCLLCAQPSVKHQGGKETFDRSVEMMMRSRRN